MHALIQYVSCQRGNWSASAISCCEDQGCLLYAVCRCDGDRLLGLSLHCKYVCVTAALVYFHHTIHYCTSPLSPDQSHMSVLCQM